MLNCQYMAMLQLQVNDPTRENEVENSETIGWENEEFQMKLYINDEETAQFTILMTIYLETIFNEWLLKL